MGIALSESILREKNMVLPFLLLPFRFGFANGAPENGWLPGICVVSPEKTPAEFRGDQIWKMLKNVGYLQRWKLVSMKHDSVTRPSFSSARFSAFKPVTSWILTRWVKVK